VAGVEGVLKLVAVGRANFAGAGRLQKQTSSCWKFCMACALFLQELRGAGLRCGAYHADMEPAQRERVHSQWSAGRLQVITATIAVGMGACGWSLQVAAVCWVVCAGCLRDGSVLLIW